MRFIITAIAALSLAAPAAAQFAGQSQSPAPQPASAPQPTTTGQAPATGTAQPSGTPTPMTENSDSSYSAVGIPQTDKVGSDLTGGDTP